MELSNGHQAYLVGSTPVPAMSADEERDRARKIRQLRREVWLCLMSEPRWFKSFADGVIDAAREAEDTALAEELEHHANRRIRRIGPKWIATAHARADRLRTIDPLTAATERELYTRVGKQYTTPGRDEDLPRRLRANLRALVEEKQRFVMANLGLVFKVAGRFRGRGLAFRDLIQEGNLGLMRAVDLFDPERGFRFSTYAVWWIRHAADRAVADRGRDVRVPVHLVSLHRKLERVRRRFEVERGRTPNTEELAKLCGVPATKIELADRSLSHGTVPLDPIPGREHQTPVDIPDEQSARQLETHLDTEGLEDLLEHLSAFEADIVRKRFGLGERDPMTLQEIGDEYALSRERIRQIEKRALGRMREAWQH